MQEGIPARKSNFKISLPLFIFPYCCMLHIPTQTGQRFSKLTANYNQAPQENLRARFP